MSDESKIDETGELGGEGQEGEGGAPDYKALYESTKAESRKWERQSKKNYEKAKRYDELMAGEQSVEDRIAALEASNKQLEDEKARAAVVKSVAKATGVPEQIVSSLSATDEDGLTAQAKAIAENYKLPGGAPKVPEAGRFPSGEQGKAGDEDKRRFVRELFGRN